MGSLPYESHPRDDTKGGACPPLDTPAWLMVVLCYQGDSRKNKWEDSSPPSDGERYGEHSRSEWSLFLRQNSDLLISGSRERNHNSFAGNS